MLEGKPYIRIYFMLTYNNLVLNTGIVIGRYIMSWPLRATLYPGVLCNMGYMSETHLKLTFCEISFVPNICLNCPVVLNFCTMILPCPVHNCKTIGLFTRMLWTNEISRDLSLGWVTDGYPIFLHSTPVLVCILISLGNGTIFSNCLHDALNVRIHYQVAHIYDATHDDVIEWKHFLCYWPFVRGIHRSLVNSPHKGQWRRALMFSLICAWING